MIDQEQYRELLYAARSNELTETIRNIAVMFPASVIRVEFQVHYDDGFEATGEFSKVTPTESEMRANGFPEEMIQEQLVARADPPPPTPPTRRQRWALRWCEAVTAVLSAGRKIGAMVAAGIAGEPPPDAV